MRKQIKILLATLLTVFILLGFAVPVNMVGNWYQQFMPNLNGRSVTDVFFLDSLTGWAVTNATNQNPDTTYVLKTTNSGDNWIIQYRKVQTGGGFSGYFRVYFINQNTGFVCDVKGIDKTNNGGVNWTSLNAPLTAYTDMSVLNTDTIWIVTPDSFMDGVFRTTNGGASWTPRLNLGSQNPNHVYFYNGRLGFVCKDNVYLRRTTDSGSNWTVISGENGFTDIYFIDSLTGWKCSVFGMKKTTDGGLNWVTQTLPGGGIIQTNGISSFSNLNRDTIWANGGYVLFPNNRVYSILNHTTDGGVTWKFQIPDTSAVNNIVYYFVNFTSKFHGWATDINPARGEIHTTNGGDTTFYTGLIQLSTNIPKDFELLQNYPNPFNPRTLIGYRIRVSGVVKLAVFDITGKEVTLLVNQKQSVGSYEVDFTGTGYSSGVYFYSLIIDDKVFDTKKMVLVK